MQLVNETNQLIEECDACLHRFQEMRRLDREPDFFNEVKPHVDEVHTRIHEWQQHATNWIESQHPKIYMYSKLTTQLMRWSNLLYSLSLKERAKTVYSIDPICPIHIEAACNKD